MNLPSSAKNPLRQKLFIGGAIVFIIIALLLYFTGGRIVSTDDAYVQAAHVDISTNIAGRVTNIVVKENQYVHKGDALFELDNRDYLIAVKDASAKLASAKLQVSALKATYLQRQANVRAAEATEQYAQHEYQRQKTLADQGIASQQQLEQARHLLSDATQALAAVKQDQQNTRALLANNPEIKIDELPSVQQAQAMLEHAELNLSYTQVKAPMDGVASKVDRLQVGEYINAAMPLFSLTSTTQIWVDANFKETELAHIRAGQKATITIDAYPDKTFEGSLDSFSSGTGSSFSLLPPENATGNWVKVVQRVPVRIRIDNLDTQHPLHAGLSANVDIDTGRNRLKDF